MVKEFARIRYYKKNHLYFDVDSPMAKLSNPQKKVNLIIIRKKKSFNFRIFQQLCHSFFNPEVAKSFNFQALCPSWIFFIVVLIELIEC